MNTSTNYRICVRLPFGLGVCIAILLSGSIQAQTPRTGPVGGGSPPTASVQQLSLRVEQLEHENEKLRAEVIALRKRLQEMESATNAQRPPRRAAPKSATTLRVIGQRRRDVYSEPGSGIIGKVEPGAILVIVQTVQTGNLVWYGVQLKSGSMYTTPPPSQSLSQGWVPSIAVEMAQDGQE